MDNSDNSIPIKAKRGRKSKKELMASLNMEQLPIIKDINTTSVKDIPSTQSINLNITELPETDDNNTNKNEIMNDDNNIVIISNPNNDKPPIKKRGRKPKGGKIIQQFVSNDHHKEDKPNVILHLKCCMKDLNIAGQSSCFVESFNFQKNNLTYEIIQNENTNTNHKLLTTFIDENDNANASDDESVCKDTNKEIWKKLKQLEQNLHVNNFSNKKSACFWDTCEFDNPPVYIPKHFINNTYEVYGCFCSPECAVAYLMKEHIDSSTRFERYHNLNLIYTKVYDYKKNIKPAPDVLHMLDKFYGNLSIQEYRSLLRNERLFLIVDKPLTRILPELHEDNDDFILNNKIIPSNNYNIKTRLQRKKQDKSSILNQNFGITVAE
jgi:hypothetical protein